MNRFTSRKIRSPHPLFIIIVSIFAAAAVIGGLVGLGDGLLRWNYSRLSWSWPAAQGEITSSKIDPETLSQDAPNPYEIKIQYRYTVHGQEYSGTRVSFTGSESLSWDQAQSILRRFPAKKDVRVYYDPSNPAQSVLEPGLDKNIWFPVWVGGVFLVVGLGLGVLMIRVVKFKS